MRKSWNIDALNLLNRYRYLLVWVATYIFFVIIGLQHTSPRSSIISSGITLVPMITLSAIVHFLLIPYFLARHKMWLFYMLSFAAFLVVDYGAIELDKFMMSHFDTLHYRIIRGRVLESDITMNVFLQIKYSFLLVTSFTATVITYFLHERDVFDARLKEAKLQEEIKYLKTQINPHFLFNALNCIYSLAYAGDSRTPDSVLRLSEMMRYVTDDCQDDKVPISKELSYIESYIAFQTIRMERSPDLHFVKEVEDTDWPISPMLLQPLVENCFKHCHLDTTPGGHIDIRIRQSGGHLDFTAENTKPPVAYTPDKNEERTGIGIHNVRQRLNLLYDGRHAFRIVETETSYRVELSLDA